MNKGFLNVMIVIIGLQSMVIIPSDFNNDAQDEEVQGVLIDPERDESLVDQSGSTPDVDDRTTQLELNAPLLDFKMISDNRLVEAIQAILGFSVVFFLIYKAFRAHHDSNK